MHKTEVKTKEELRTEISKKKHQIPATKKEKFDNQIYKNITGLPEWKKAKKVFIYISMKDEVDTRALIKNYLGKKIIIVPKSHTKFNKLTLHEIKSFDDTEKGSYSIMEPKSHTRIITPEEVDLVIIPGIVFDKNGHRIGYGKGYYDRLTKHLTCHKIGLAYKVQIVNNIPAQKHDVPVDTLVTEETVYRINK
ncbi:5-formyltetrahydrofolate cyclo-ligase [bacterium]|nr:5-formyltetrahydrofolate cyclo-ligase [bacterium]